MLLHPSVTDVAQRRTAIDKALREGIAYGIDMSQEVWRDIVGYEGLYEISNFGAVRSKFKIATRLDGTEHLLKPCYLKPDKTQGAYRVGLRRDGASRNWLVSRLVLATFVEPCPEGMEACHYPDSNKANNRLDNLRWDTSLANQQDRILDGATTKGRIVNPGEENGMAKVTWGMVREMRRLYATGVRQTILCKMFGLGAPQVHSIVKGKAWKE